MILFDIGANRGDAVFAGLQKGYKVIALEAAPRVFAQLVNNFIYDENVIPLRFAVSDTNEGRVEFYECIEDGLSTLNKDWLTQEGMPYAGKPYRTITATTCTIDWLVSKYGEPDLIKIDVEGAEWAALKGMTKSYGMLTFEWTQETLPEHQKQLQYLQGIGYKEVAMQFIEHHLTEPEKWSPIDGFDLLDWVKKNSSVWENEGWKKSRLRPTADVGMCWVR